MIGNEEGKMKKIWRFWIVFAFGFLLYGCIPSKALPTEEMGNQPEIVVVGTQTSPAQPAQASPYPLTGQEVPNVPQEVVPNPQAINETGNETPTPIGNQTPTPHVDVILRATDPNAFVLASGKYQMVEFFAFWCPTCKSLAPVLKNLENKYAGKIQFIYLDIDDPRTNPFKQALGYQYQPHLFLIDGEGKVLMQWVGYVAEEELDAVLSSLQ